VGRGEYSAATFLRTREKGFRYIALPIFFERGPRQRNIYFCEGKLNHPSELKGKKIGCFRYGATAVVWARGFLLDEYGLKTTDMNWYVSGREVYIGNDLPVKVERLDPSPPFGQEKPHLARLVSKVSSRCSGCRRFGLSGLFGGGTLPKPWVSCRVKPFLMTEKSSAGFDERDLPDHSSYRFKEEVAREISGSARQAARSLPRSKNFQQVSYSWSKSRA
jgi:hypothetical protein